MTDKDQAQAELRKLPLKEGDKFTHYKAGGTYEIVTLAVKEDTLEPMVVYCNLERKSTWVRTHENFIEEVEYKDQFVPRFRRI